MTGSTDPRLPNELEKQLGFLQRSADDFDNGDEAEAVRLATTMRVLFHDTAKSTSLLTLLSMQNTTMLATARSKFADWRDFLSMRIDLASLDPITLIPRLDVQLQPTPFKTWWESDSVTNAAGISVSRRRLILAAANKDGGAHVDPKLERFYENLIGGEYALGLTGNLTFDGPPPFAQGVAHYASNGHLALLRQFAHEVLATADHDTWVK